MSSPAFLPVSKGSLTDTPPHQSPARSAIVEAWQPDDEHRERQDDGMRPGMMIRRPRRRKQMAIRPGLNHTPGGRVGLLPQLDEAILYQFSIFLVFLV
jgi:hypothetical protein